MLETRTSRWASETGRSLSHLAKVRSARPHGKSSVNQVLERRGMVRRQAGSKAGAGEGAPEPIRARWMGVA